MIYFSIIQNNVFPNSYVELLEGSSEDTCRMHMMSLQKKLEQKKHKSSRPKTCQPLLWLVGGLEHFLFSHILGIIIPTDFHIFQRGSNHQPDGILYTQDIPLSQEIPFVTPRPRTLPGLLPWPKRWWRVDWWSLRWGQLLTCTLV